MYIIVGAVVPDGSPSSSETRGLVLGHGHIHPDPRPAALLHPSREESSSYSAVRADRRPQTAEHGARSKEQGARSTEHGSTGARSTEHGAREHGAVE